MKKPEDILAKNQERIKKAFEANGVPEQNQKFVFDYIRSLKLSSAKIRTTINDQEAVAFFTLHVRADFDKLTKHDIYDFIEALKTCPGKRTKKPLAESSQNLYKICTKKFLLWLGEEIGQEERFRKLAEDKVLYVNRGAVTRKLPDDILTMEEVRAMVEAASGAKGKAIVATTYDAGGRLGEIDNCKVKDATENSNGFKLRLQGKTGERIVQLVWSASYLRTWLKVHPLRDNPEAPLWVTTRRERDGETKKIGYRQMAPRSIQGTIYDAAEKAGIKKKAHPHLLRHSKATHLASKLSDQQLKVFFGWTPGSNTTATYMHLCGRDIDDAILEFNGLKPEAKKENLLGVRECPRCHRVNGKEAEYCDICGFPLTKEAESGRDQVIAEILGLLTDDPQKLAEILAKTAQK